MSIRKRLLWAIGALAAGACLALPFQKAPQAPSQQKRQGDILSSTAAAASSLLAPPALADEAAEAKEDPERASRPSHREATGGSLTAAEDPTVAAVEAAASQALLPLTAPAPPSLPRRFPAALETAEDRSAPAGTGNHVVVPSPGDAEPSPAPSTPPAEPPPPTLIVRRHRIRDGDTLEKLAQRYLGAAERRQEILDRNQPLLADPELLPIGQEIEILVEADRFARD